MADSGKLGIFQRLSKALGIYWKMNAEEKKIVRTRTIDGAHTAQYWLDFVDESAEFDHYADSVRAKIGTASAIILAVLLFISVFLIAFLADADVPFLGSFYLFFAGTAVFLALLGILMYFYLKSKDIGNQLRLFIVPLIQVLKDEMLETELIHLKVDLRKKDRKDNEVHREKNYKPSFFSKFRWFFISGIFVFIVIAVGNNDETMFFIAFFGIFASVFVLIFSMFFEKYPKILTTLHLHPWLELKARLVDGSRLQILIKDDIARYRITRKKRGSSGKTKIKTKTKYKIRTNFYITLGLQNKRYEVENVGSELRNALGIKMKHRPGEKRNALKVNFRLKSKDILAVPDFQTFLGLIGGAYKKAEPIQK